MRVVASPNAKSGGLTGDIDHMNDPTGILFQTKTFQNHIVSIRSVDLCKVVLVALSLEDKWVGRFADLTLKGLPKVSCDVTGNPFLSLHLDPILQTAIVDVLDSSSALARGKKGVCDWSVCVPAEPTLRKLPFYVILLMLIAIHLSHCLFLYRYLFLFFKVFFRNAIALLVYLFLSFVVIALWFVFINDAKAIDFIPISDLVAFDVQVTWRLTPISLVFVLAFIQHYIRSISDDELAFFFLFSVFLLFIIIKEELVLGLPLNILFHVQIHDIILSVVQRVTIVANE